MTRDPRDVRLNNRTAREGCSRCTCGCKYWENDRCVDCGEPHDIRNDARCWNCGGDWLDSCPDADMPGTDMVYCRSCGGIQDEDTIEAWLAAR